MTTKQWLERGRGFVQEIAILEREKDSAALRAVKITRDLSGEKLAKTPMTRSDAALIKYADSDYIARIDKRLADLRGMLGEISRAIYSVQNGPERLLLISRYIMLKKWQDIAAEMAYHPKSIFKIHKKALKSVKLATK